MGDGRSSYIHNQGIKRYFTAAIKPYNAFILLNAVCLGFIFSKSSLLLSKAGKMNCCGSGCRSPSIIKEYYDNTYFSWQIPYGKRRAAERDWNLFLKANPNFTVADLGAGGGFVLSTLKVKKKIAIEVNDVARDYIKHNFPDIHVYKYPEDVPNYEMVDILLSIDSAEHMECPITELREMAKRVRKGGKVIVSVKNEGVGYAIPAVENDIHQHFYTWAPQNLHNLVKAAGFKMIGISPSIKQMNATFNRWTPDTFTTWRANFVLVAWGEKL